MSNVAVSIAGDVINSTVVAGNDNFVLKMEKVEAGAVVNVFKPGTQPRYWSKAKPIVALPRPFPALIGRQNEVALLQNAQRVSASVSMWARRGMGKTAIARNLTHVLNQQDPSDSILYLDAMGRGLEDVLQALFEAFFDSAPFYSPNPTSIPTILQHVKALVFVDNLAITGDAVDSLLNAAPGCTFVLITNERIPWQEGESLPLQGLQDADAIALFERGFGHPVGPSEKDLVSQICKMLNGCPSDILQTAARGRETGQSVNALLMGLRVQGLDDASRAALAIGPLSDNDRRLLSLLASAGENAVPLEIIKSTFKDMDAAGELQRLKDLGLVQSHSPRYSLVGTLAAGLAANWALAGWQDALLDYSLNWLAQQRASEAVEESLGMLLKVLKDATERNRWKQVIQLGRLLERFLIYYKRWQAWSDVLDLILRAARAVLDRTTEGWALHQLGSRALFRGAFEPARTYLTQALTLRRAIGDRAGIAVTQHNLTVLNGFVQTGGQGGRGGAGRGGHVLGYGFAGFGGILLIAAVIFLLIRPPTPGPTPPPPPPATTVPASHTPSWTPSSTPVDTRTPTSTPTPTNTPTSMPTSTPAPVVLFDFIDHADQAQWSWDTGSGPTSIPFYPTMPSPYYKNADDYYYNNGAPYIGWDYDASLSDGRVYKQALLTYPAIWAIVSDDPSHLAQIAFRPPVPLPSRNSVGGKFYIDIPQTASGLYLEVNAGYKNPGISTTTSLAFRVYVNDNVVIDQQLNPYASFYLPQLPIKPVSPGKTNLFGLQVENLGKNIYDPGPGMWTVVRLWGTLASSGGGGKGYAQATFMQDANCRSGPSTAYGLVTAFQTGQTVQIFGRNPDFSNTWWYVQIPGTSRSCWVSLITANATGNFDAIPVVP